MPDSGNPEPVRGAAPSGGSKRGFGRLGDMESRDSVAVLESGRRDEGGREYEMNGYQGEDAGRAKEWFKQARM